MATTPKGYPYPVGTDRVADGDNAIRALAEAVESLLGVAATGSGAITTTGSNPSNGSLAVTFPVGRFTAAGIVPRVFLCQMSAFVGGTGGYAAVYPSGISTSGFTANCRRADVQTTSFVYLATTLDV
jgi:hypothetical protein